MRIKRPMNINKSLAKYSGERVCEICKSESRSEKLNYNAIIHHGASRLCCIDRKACERRKRKKR